MRRRFVVAACLLLAVLFLFPAAAFAAAPQGEGTAVWIDDQTVTAGNSFSFYVRARGLENVGTLSLFLYYDTEQFEFSAVSAQSLISGQTTSTNTRNAGEVGMDFISLDGVSGTGDLWRITLKAKSTATPGKHTLTLAVGEAYSTSLSPITVASGNAAVTVNERAQSVTNISFYSSCSPSSLSVGGSTTVKFYSNNLQGLATADFEITYDHTMLRLDGVTLGASITGAQGAVYSINDQSPGYVKINFVAMNGITGGSNPMVSLKFTALQNLDTTTTVKLKPSNLYDADLRMMNASELSARLSLYRTEVIPDLPDFVLGDFEGVEDGFTLELTAPGETGLAAADFVFNFDPEMLQATEVTRVDSAHLMFFDIDNEKGKITVSFIDENGIDATGAILRISFTTKDLKGGNTTVSFVGKNMVDADFADIKADFLGGALVLHKHGAAATCTEDEICAVEGCDKVLAERLGHIPVSHEGQAPTCTENGWEPYETCTRCDYTSYTVIPALGHDEIPHDAKEPTCTEVGWNAYVTCSRCDYTTYNELKALGHRVLVDGRVWVDSYTALNDAKYPFAFVDGVYTSTNKVDGTVSIFTITAQYDCTLEIRYAVGSEQNYDKLIIRHNNKEIDAISGVVDWKTATLSLVAGDVVTVRYQKDGSVSTNGDTGRFSFSCTQSVVGSMVPAPAEEQSPTCTEAVVCHYCQTVVKKALGHDEIPHEAKQVTCTEIGWEDYETCSRCNYTTYVEIPAKGHRYVSTEKYDVIEYLCSHCADFYTEKIERGPVSLKNTVFTTAWELDFTTSVQTLKPIAKGEKFRLYYNTAVASLLNATGYDKVRIDDSEEGVLIVELLDTAIAGESLFELSFRTDTYLCVGEHTLLSVDAASVDGCEFSKLVIYDMGDVNLDGKINSRDVMMIKQYVVKMIDLTAAQKAYANVYVDEDKDGNPLISSRDALLIQQYVVKMDVQLGNRVELEFSYDVVTTPEETTPSEGTAPPDTSGDAKPPVEYEDKTYTVPTGESFEQVPEAPEGYVWSESEKKLIEPDFSAIMEDKKYYLIMKKESDTV